MALLLHIETAISGASICLSNDDHVLDADTNKNEQQHTAWLHVAIKNLLLKNKVTTRQLDAIAVSIGPGSYTGLRIGLASAKGLCYALKIPLIAIGTLEMMAAATKTAATVVTPMIDARR